MIVIGIDPGLTGALAFVDSARRQAVIEDIPTIEVPGKSTVRRRVDGKALADIVRRHAPPGVAALTICEAVHAQGGASAQNMGSLMRTLGAIEAVFDVLRFPAAMVTPQAWQKHYGLSGKGAPRAEGELHAGTKLAAGMYPCIGHMLRRVKDHNRAEALLIAHYGAETLA